MGERRKKERKHKGGTLLAEEQILMSNVLDIIPGVHLYTQMYRHSD